MARPIEVTIESLGGLGDGIASLGGKPIFIPKSCVGDRLEVNIVQEKSDKFHGAISKVLSPGPTRQPAPCSHFEQCGGCTMQQLAPASYREFKTRMLHGALAQAGFPSPESSVLFLPPHTRRRVECKIHYDNGKVQLAFHALRSHTPVIISECPVLHPELEALIAPLGEALSELPFAEQLFSVSLTKADSGIDLLLTFKKGDINALPNLDWLGKKLSLGRISAQIPDSKPKILSQLHPVEMQLGDYAITLPPGAFLQATAEGQTALVNAVMEATIGQSSAVDLFCGIGTYSFPLSRKMKTHAVEGEKDMVEAIRSAAARHGIKNLSSEQRDLMQFPLTAKELNAYEAATFARDAAILKKSGFALTSAQGIDQFLWSQHLEIVAVFRR